MILSHVLAAGDRRSRAIAFMKTIEEDAEPATSADLLRAWLILNIRQRPIFLPSVNHPL